jgi:hypothetical protein
LRVGVLDQFRDLSFEHDERPLHVVSVFQAFHHGAEMLHGLAGARQKRHTGAGVGYTSKDPANQTIPSESTRISYV